MKNKIYYWSPCLNPVGTIVSTINSANAVNEYSEKYGSQTIVLMQCGAFFEVYGKKDKHGNISGSNIIEYSHLTELKKYSTKGNGIK